MGKDEAIGVCVGYDAFGSLLPGRNYSSDAYRFGFQGQVKDDEIYGATGTSYTAEFWQYDSRTGRRWNLDPRPVTSVSFYAAFMNNPIGFTDVRGDTSEFFNIANGASLGTINDAGAFRRIKINQDIYNGSVNNASKLFGKGFMDGSSEQDKANFLANSITGAGELGEDLARYAGITNPDYIAFETGDLSISITGAMRFNSQKLADVNLTIKSHFDNNSTLDIASFSGVAGGFGNGAPQNGNYTLSNYQNRTRSGWFNPGMNRNGVGFSFNLNPLFATGRGLLRIHPDGNNEGTLGCIGLTGTALQLTNFSDLVRANIQQCGAMNTAIDIDCNPNISGGNSVPNVRE